LIDEPNPGLAQRLNRGPSRYYTRPHRSHRIEPGKGS
jgi:hypothetical protein